MLDGSPNHAAYERPIAWTGASYVLRSGQDCWRDSGEFAALGMRGDEALAAGTPGRGCEFYAAALALWRGPVVVDIDCLQEHPLVVALSRWRPEVVLRAALHPEGTRRLAVGRNDLDGDLGRLKTGALGGWPVNRAGAGDDYAVWRGALRAPLITVKIALTFWPARACQACQAWRARRAGQG